ncbi:MaoC family dehydratase [Nitratireductor mangrovi]|uniref:MaoC family dehydratase n=1 Tax=Nitratireductor mangrovi TaxID=2599600 RepID=A0A5B8L2L8_9HYPH|nr:MaoC family dehydratase [Nitratireductor mangrovi]QDZ02063.1 MaoC family dehydratase [Nitratireductor mangrovi]
MTDKKWAFEDFEVGGAIEFGPRLVTAEEMIDFASRYDPQPMHLDEAAGKASMLGGLSAAGLFTASLFMRMMCDAYILDSTSQGAPGVDYVNFRKPLLAGDTLTGRSVILEKRISKSRPGLGFVSVRHELRNQRGEVICEMANTGMFLLRNPETAA